MTKILLLNTYLWVNYYTFINKLLGPNYWVQRYQSNIRDSTVLCASAKRMYILLGEK